MPDRRQVTKYEMKYGAANKVYISKFVYVIGKIVES